MEQQENNAAQEAVKEEKFENVGGETTQQQEPKWYHKTGAYVAEKACNTAKIVKENPVEATVIAVVTGGIYKAVSWGFGKMFSKTEKKED